MSLLNAAERFASIDRSQIVLDTERCLHSQDQYSECTACMDICPVDAIINGKPPELKTELCQSCFACLPACPVGAYHADDDVASLMNCAVHVENQTVELVCGLHLHPETGADKESIGIRISGCLASLGIGTYIMLSTIGLKRIVSRTDACHTCKWSTLGSEIHYQTERANRFLSAWNKEETVICLDEFKSPVERVLWDAKNPPLSRRDLFRMMGRQGQFTMARAMANTEKASKRQPGRDRLRLLSAVTHLPPLTGSNLNGEKSEVLEGFGFASLVISEACTACGVCGRACPTEALQFTRNDNEMKFSISFLAQNCIGCELCVHVCLPDAVKINQVLSLVVVFHTNEPAPIVVGSLIQCERCKTFMAKQEGQKLCQLCEYRRTNPFGSVIPKKILKESRS